MKNWPFYLNNLTLDLIDSLLYRWAWKVWLLYLLPTGKYELFVFLICCLRSIFWHQVLQRAANNWCFDILKLAEAMKTSALSSTSSTSRGLTFETHDRNYWYITQDCQQTGTSCGESSKADLTQNFILKTRMTQFKIEVMSLCKGVSKILTAYRIFLIFFSFYHHKEEIRSFSTMYNT